MADFSLAMLRTAQQRCPDSSRFSLGQADVLSLPFKDDSFDIMIANFMLYHVPDLGLALSESRRVPVSGGKFYAAANGANHTRRAREIIRRFDADAEMIHVSGVFSLQKAPLSARMSMRMVI
ncbi:MAG: methyltransferase domain-containing protein [Anaerolineales bacterium]|nr:methyltransferase domain-containing protein [Anaerolineales bacterium]